MSQPSQTSDGIVVNGDRRWLVLLPGFQTPASAYRGLAEAIAAGGPTVYVPQVVRPGPMALLGKPDVQTEAVRATAVVAAVRRARKPTAVVVAGHSRGGLAAWLMADHVDLDGLVLIDPVDAAGPRPRRPAFTLQPTLLPYEALIIGAGRAGPCAPAGVNHEAFAGATPGCRHVVLPDLGHADILSGRWRSGGRRLCGGGADPAAGRQAVAGLIGAVMRSARA